MKRELDTFHGEPEAGNKEKAATAMLSEMDEGVVPGADPQLFDVMLFDRNANGESGCDQGREEPLLQRSVKDALFDFGEQS